MRLRRGQWDLRKALETLIALRSVPGWLAMGPLQFGTFPTCSRTRFGGCQLPVTQHQVSGPGKVQTQAAPPASPSSSEGWGLLKWMWGPESYFHDNRRGALRALRRGTQPAVSLLTTFCRHRVRGCEAGREADPQTGPHAPLRSVWSVAVETEEGPRTYWGRVNQV